MAQHPWEKLARTPMLSAAINFHNS